MKKLVYFIILITTISCNNEKNAAESENSDEQEEIVQKDNVINRELISNIQGEYYVLQNAKGQLYYQEPCNMSEYNLRISETVEYSNEWTIDWDDSQYTISSIEGKNKDIYISTLDDEFTFIFEPTSKSHTWNFMELGVDAIHSIGNIEYIEQLETKPCTDISALLSNLSSSWYELTETDGREVIFFSCQEPPGGFDLGDAWYDPRSGSDPYEIVKVSKMNNSITLTFYSQYDDKEWSIELGHMQDGNTIIKGDRKYVSKETKDNYPTVNEEC